MAARKLNAVCIPVYKEIPDGHEDLSFFQCLRILGRHDIYIFSHKGLDLSHYIDGGKKLGCDVKVKYFDKSYFNSVKGYNQLMLLPDFYRAFSGYKYILIYQLDAYVFSDDLDDWCNRGYDYIGAPWFEHFGCHEDGNKLWRAGNGGFSLRRIDYFIKALTWRGPVHRFSRVPGKSLFGSLFDFLGHKNRIGHILKNDAVTTHEDVFLAFRLEGSLISPKMPSAQEASKFAFEQSPSYLFEANGNRLPFGCHAFLKYEYDSFWRNYITSAEQRQQR